MKFLNFKKFLYDFEIQYNGNIEIELETKLFINYPRYKFKILPLNIKV